MTERTDVSPATSSRRSRATIAFAAVLALPIVALAIFALAWPPDGQAHGGDAWRFAGRLHPMLVHLPIGLLMLVPVLELAGAPRRFRHLRASAGLVLGLGAVAAIVAAAHGYVLARFDGISGNGLTWHLWAGATTAALAVLAIAMRATSAIAYAATLAALLVALAFAGHLGGQLTYGESYLSEVAPPAIARFLGPVDETRAPSPPVARTSPATAPASLPTTEPATLPVAVVEPSRAVMFAGDVAPMFAASCVSCHGPVKVKGGLRLDTYAALMQGGESGPAIVAGDAAASDLFNRMTLPPTDDDAMPPVKSQAARPTAAQIAAVKRWITEGAKR